MSASSLAIQAIELTRHFGDFVAVDGISFNVHPQEVVGYLGPNGSGKTTTIRMLLGLLRPTRGKAYVLGYDAFRQTEQVRARAGYMSQKFGLYHDLTVGENLSFYSGVYGVQDRGRLQNIAEQMGLKALLRERVSELPAGWRQRLALAASIIHRPQLLFLDEPTSGVDPLARREFWDLIYTLVEEGVTALVTTHYMDEAEYCGRVGIMREGRLLAMDTPTALKKHALPGTAWDVFIAQSSLSTKQEAVIPPAGSSPAGADEAEWREDYLLMALNILQDSPLVIRSGLSGDHLRAITPPGVEAGALLALMAEAGLPIRSVEQTEASLEDVFLALAN